MLPPVLLTHCPLLLSCWSKCPFGGKEGILGGEDSTVAGGGKAGHGDPVVAPDRQTHVLSWDLKPHPSAHVAGYHHPETLAVAPRGWAPSAAPGAAVGVRASSGTLAGTMGGPSSAPSLAGALWLGGDTARLPMALVGLPDRWCSVSVNVPLSCRGSSAPRCPGGCMEGF